MWCTAVPDANFPSLQPRKRYVCHVPQEEDSGFPAPGGAALRKNLATDAVDSSKAGFPGLPGTPTIPALRILAGIRRDRFVPFVLGPSGVPVIDDAARAHADPELAVPSAMAHGRDSDPERSTLYFDLVAASLGAAARKALQDMDPATPK